MSVYKLKIDYKERMLSWKRIYEYLCNYVRLKDKPNMYEVFTYFKVENLFDVADVIHKVLVDNCDDVILLLIMEYRNQTDEDKLIEYELLIDYLITHHGNRPYTQQINFNMPSALFTLYEDEILVMEHNLDERLSKMHLITESISISDVYKLHEKSGLVYCYSARHSAYVLIAVRNKHGIYKPVRRSHSQLMRLLVPDKQTGVRIGSYEEYIIHLHDETH